MKLTSHMKKIASYLLVALLLLSSCNKDVPAPVANTFPTPTGQSIGEIVNTNTSFSLLKHALTRVGLITALTNKNSVFTVFAPNDAAFAAAGITSTAAIDGLPLATLTSIISYHVIPGYKLNSTAIPTTFPNIQMPTSFVFPAPNTNPLVRFSIFPSRRGTSVWANNIPVTAVDIAAANGVIHQVAVVVAPPSRILLDTIARDPDFTLLVAAIQRADAGRNINLLSDSSIQFFLGNATAAVATNFTVFAPTNTAFKNLVSALTAGAIGTGEPDATYVGFINTLPPATVRGILAYHVIPQRAFGVNFPTTTASFPTLVNGSIPTHPGVAVTATITGGFATGLTVKGVGNATAATATPTAAGVDRIAINGVFYKINQVLLPQ
jgi:uncharacterized surface protein with fasciclin (FAS1) repeats